MAKIEEQREYRGKSSSDCYQAGLRTVTAAGYSIFKKREIASLVICNGTLQGSQVELSLMVPLGGPTRVVLSLSCDQCDQDALKAETERLFEILDREVKG